MLYLFFVNEFRMSTYILVVEHERDDPLELPCEDDGTLLLSTLQGQYPTTTGLKYKNPDTGAYRAIRLAEGKLYPPTDGGWGNAKFVAVFPKPGETRLSSSRYSHAFERIFFQLLIPNARLTITRIKSQRPKLKSWT